MEKAFKCDLCTEKFHSLGKLSAHIELQHEELLDGKKNLKCNVCGYQCSKGQVLIRHIRTHTGERPFKCQVSDCGMAFKQASDLKNHIKFKHSDERPLKCDFPGCFHTDKNSTNLMKHKKVHSDERPFPCPHSGCNFWAKRTDDLSKHTSGAHGDSIKLTCSKCEYNTNVASNLTRHMITHVGKNENIPCSVDGCEYKGKHREAVRMHMRRHKTRLPCPASGCGHYATTKESLKNHLELHDARGRAFQCALCFKYYRTLQHLQEHCAVHTNEKPFQCGHCQFEGARQGFVKAHISSVHAAIDFPFIVHLLDDRECLRCKVTLPSAQFVVHYKGHVNPVLIN